MEVLKGLAIFTVIIVCVYGPIVLFERMETYCYIEDKSSDERPSFTLYQHRNYHGDTPVVKNLPSLKAAKETAVEYDCALK